jgi:hypothetical protein
VDTTVLIAVLTSGTALVVSLMSFAANLWTVQRDRRTKVLDLVARYRDPLLWAAFELRNRLYGIIGRKGLSQAHQRGGHDWKLAQDYTLFVVSQYLGWVEILRQGIQFLDLGEDRRNRDLVEIIYDITRTFATAKLDGDTLHLPRGEQRAIGELVISLPAQRDDLFGCIGYATFCARLEDDERFAAWFMRTRAQLKQLAMSETNATERLVTLHNRLTDLIDFLDPDAVRFPSRLREHLNPPPPTGSLPAGSS